MLGYKRRFRQQESLRSSQDQASSLQFETPLRLIVLKMDTEDISGQTVQLLRKTFDFLARTKFWRRCLIPQRVGNSFRGQSHSRDRRSFKLTPFISCQFVTSIQSKLMKLSKQYKCELNWTDRHQTVDCPEYPIPPCAFLQSAVSNMSRAGGKGS